MGLKEAPGVLRAAPIYDVDGRLKPRGRAELRRAIDASAAKGLRARVVIVGRDADLKRWRTLWGELKLDPRRDLLLVCSGWRGEARGGGLTPKQISRKLDAAEPELARYLAAGLVAALGSLRPAEPASGFVGSGIALGGGALALAALGWVIARRGRRGAAVAEKYRAAYDAAERTYADLMVDGDALADGDDILRDAARAKGELDAIDREARGDGKKMGDPVILGRLEHVGNQMSTLRTRLLQRGG